MTPLHHKPSPLVPPHLITPFTTRPQLASNTPHPYLHRTSLGSHHPLLVTHSSSLTLHYSSLTLVIHPSSFAHYHSSLITQPLITNHSPLITYLLSLIPLHWPASLTPHYSPLITHPSSLSQVLKINCCYIVLCTVLYLKYMLLLGSFCQLDVSITARYGIFNKIIFIFLQCEVLLEVEKIFRNLCHIDLDLWGISWKFQENLLFLLSRNFYEILNNFIKISSCKNAVLQPP